jgi:hypothetical protein
MVRLTANYTAFRSLSPVGLMSTELLQPSKWLIGEDFPSVETAIVHAFRIAAELGADDPNYQWHAVKVIGEGGNEVARVPIKGGRA